MDEGKSIESTTISVTTANTNNKSEMNTSSSDEDSRDDLETVIRTDLLDAIMQAVIEEQSMEYTVMWARAALIEVLAWGLHLEGRPYVDGRWGTAPNSWAVRQMAIMETVPSDNTDLTSVDLSKVNACKDKGDSSLADDVHSTASSDANSFSDSLEDVDLPNEEDHTILGSQNMTEEFEETSDTRLVSVSKFFEPMLEKRPPQESAMYMENSKILTGNNNDDGIFSSQTDQNSSSIKSDATLLFNMAGDDNATDFTRTYEHYYYPEPLRKEPDIASYLPDKLPLIELQPLRYTSLNISK